MVKNLKFNSRSYRYFLIFVIFLTLSISSCSPQPTIAQPAINEAEIIDAVVKTINAQNTQVALLQPSNTPAPTQTPIPPSPTPLPDTPTPTITPEPSNTPTQEAAISASVLYVVSYPENKREYVGNESFGIALGFRNTGTITWEAGSKVKLISYVGEPTVQLETTIDKAVAPGEKVEFNLWAFGSEWYGDHTFVFQLFTAQGFAIPGGYATFTYTSI